MDESSTAIVNLAERIIYQARWRIQEQVTLDSLAGSKGLRWAPLDRRSDVIQLVTYDGEHIGHIRRDQSAEAARPWVAVLREPARMIGRYPTVRAAADALASATGRPVAD